MKVIKAGFEIITPIDSNYVLRLIETAGRNAYKSEMKNIDADIEITKRFIKNIINKKHESVLEHFSFSVRFICDRGISHELVRHRIASYTQSSTRYCNYSDDRFGSELTFIKPLFWDEGSESYKKWVKILSEIESTYMEMIHSGETPEKARTILPNSLQTDIIVTMNIRSWRNFFLLRCDKSAHPQMRELTLPLLEKCKELIPIVFDDLIF